MAKYRVQFYLEDEYHVFENNQVDESEYDDQKTDYSYDDEEPVFRGRLADCEAYIRLHEGGYM